MGYSVHVALLASVSFLLLAPSVVSYPNGAPQSACVSMVPGHGNASDTLLSPYSIDVFGATQYHSDATIQVHVTGGPYKGILLQVRAEPDPTPLGTFLPRAAQWRTRTLLCSATDDSITHSVAEDKGEEEVFVWQPPEGDQGSVRFIATVATEKMTWYHHQHSVYLTYGQTPSAATRPATALTWITLSVLITALYL